MPLIYDSCICHHFYRGISTAHPLDAIPVGSCPVLVEKAAFGEQECSGTDAGRQVSVPVLLHNPVEQASIVPFAACALSTWNEQDIEGWGDCQSYNEVSPAALHGI